jgi:hypothetical protein
MVSRLSIAILLSSALSASSFTISQQRDPSTALLASRRDFVGQGAAIVGAALVAGSLPSFADVSDGNALPQGAQQFSKMIRVKADLKVNSSLFVESLLCKPYKLLTNRFT